MEWKFERTEQQFDEVPVGQYRVRIEEAEKQVSKSGKDMIRLVFAVSGQRARLFHYVVFLEDRPEITNRNLTAIFDSFGIADGDFVLSHWKGKVGGCTVKHDEEGRAKVQYFLNKVQQERLPAWEEVGKSVPQSLEDLTPDDGDLPF